MNIFQNKHARRLYDEICANYPVEEQFLKQFLQKSPAFSEILTDILLVFDALVSGFRTKHKLFLCGNGGSFADAMHIAGELMKSFKRSRPLSQANKRHFAGREFADILTQHLECGLPCIVLGLNHSLFSAIQNDKPVDAIQYAQELYALGEKDDMLLGMSTSGNALNVLYAVSTAKALGMKTIALTGKTGGKLAQTADIAVKAPETSTESVQEQHVIIYHTLCAMLEARFFSKT